MSTGARPRRKIFVLTPSQVRWASATYGLGSFLAGARWWRMQTGARLMFSRPIPVAQ